MRHVVVLRQNDHLKLELGNSSSASQKIEHNLIHREALLLLSDNFYQYLWRCFSLRGCFSFTSIRLYRLREGRISGEPGTWDIGFI